MSGGLLDIYVLSELRRKWPEKKVIAATARHHGLTVVSRDAAEFRRAKVAVFDPWRDAFAY